MPRIFLYLLILYNKDFVNFSDADGSSSKPATPASTAVVLDIKKTESTEQFDFSKIESEDLRIYTPKKGYVFNLVKKSRSSDCLGTGLIWEADFLNEYLTKIILKGSKKGPKYMLMLPVVGNFMLYNKQKNDDGWNDITSETISFSNITFFGPVQNSTDVRELDSSNYERTTHNFSFGYRFKDGVKCTKIMYKETELWVHNGDSSKPYPLGLYYEPVDKSLKLLFPCNKWEKPNISIPEPTRIVLENFDIVTEGSDQPNDTTKYHLKTMGDITEYKFKDGAKCVEVKYKGETVWKHDPAKHKDKYPELVYLHTNIKTIFIVSNGYLYVYKYGFDTWTGDLTKTVKLDIKSKESNCRYEFKKDLTVGTYSAQRNVLFNKVIRSTGKCELGSDRVLLESKEPNQYAYKVVIEGMGGKDKKIRLYFLNGKILSLGKKTNWRGFQAYVSYNVPDIDIVTEGSDQPNDTTKYNIIKNESKECFDYVFNDGAKCVEVKYKGETVWKFDKDKPYPKYMSYDKKTQVAIITFENKGICIKREGDKCFKQIFKYKGDVDRKSFRSPLKIPMLLLTNIKIVTEGSEQPNDTTKYHLKTMGDITEYKFKDGAKCVEVKYKGETVWKHDPAKHQEMYPELVKVFVRTKVIFVLFKDGFLYSYKHFNNKWHTLLIGKPNPIQLDIKSKSDTAQYSYYYDKNTKFGVYVAKGSNVFQEVIRIKPTGQCGSDTVLLQAKEPNQYAYKVVIECMGKDKKRVMLYQLNGELLHLCKKKETFKGTQGWVRHDPEVKMVVEGSPGPEDINKYKKTEKDGIFNYDFCDKCNSLDLMFDDVVVWSHDDDGTYPRSVIYDKENGSFLLSFYNHTLVCKRVETKWKCVKRDSVEVIKPSDTVVVTEIQTKIPATPTTPSLPAAKEEADSTPKSEDTTPRTPAVTPSSVPSAAKEEADSTPSGTPATKEADDSVPSTTPAAKEDDDSTPPSTTPAGKEEDDSTPSTPSAVPAADGSGSDSTPAVTPAVTPAKPKVPTKPSVPAAPKITIERGRPKCPTIRPKPKEDKPKVPITPAIPAVPKPAVTPVVLDIVDTFLSRIKIVVLGHDGTTISIGSDDYLLLDSKNILALFVFTDKVKTIEVKYKDKSFWKRERGINEDLFPVSIVFKPDGYFYIDFDPFYYAYKFNNASGSLVHNVDGSVSELFKFSNYSSHTWSGLVDPSYHPKYLGLYTLDSATNRLKYNDNSQYKVYSYSDRMLLYVFKDGVKCYDFWFKDKVVWSYDKQKYQENFPRSICIDITTALAHFKIADRVESFEMGYKPLVQYRLKSDVMFFSRIKRELEAHERELNELNKNAEHKLKELNEEHVVEVKNLKEDHEAKLRELNEKDDEDGENKNLEEEVKKLTEEHEKEVKTLNEEHEAKVKELNEAHEDKVKTLNETHEQKFRELTEKHEKEVKNLNEEHDAKVKTLNEEHAAEVKALKEEHEKKLKEVKEKDDVGATYTSGEPVSQPSVASDENKETVDATTVVASS